MNFQQSLVRMCFGHLFVAVLFLASLGMGSAQTAGTGALTGTVTDPSGATVPNVTVTATNTGNGQARTAQTGSDGSFTISLLPPGAYKVRFSAPGFKTSDVGPVNVAVTETPVLNRALEVGAQAEQVTVEATAETVQTTNATLGTVVSTQTVTDLPLNTRNYTNILALSAGVNSTVNNATAIGKGSQDFAVNGSSNAQNNFSMDGVSIQNYGGQGTTHEGGSYTSFGIPSPDAIQEFKIQTSQYDAGYGRNPGANVNVVTKSGANQFHGTAFEFFRNTALNANDFFLNRAGAPKPAINQNQFGGVLGGPIKKDKLFFFFSYQGTRQKNGASLQTYQPSVILPPIPLGDRSNTATFRPALGAAFCPGNHPGDLRYAAIPSFFFGGTQVACDGSNINPVAVNILQAKLSNGNYLIPSSRNGSFQNSPLTVPGVYHEDQYIANVDYMLNAKNTLAARYFVSRDPQTMAFLPICSGNCLDGFPARQEFTNLYGTVKATSIVSNNMVNEALMSFQRNYTNDTPLGTITNPGVGITPTTPGINALSPMLIGGLFQIGGGSFDDQQMAVNTYVWSDQLSWTHGKHTLRTGVEFQRVQWNWDFVSIAKGALVFAAFDDFLLGRSACPPGTFPVSCNGGNAGNTTGAPVSNIIAEILPTRVQSTNGIVNGYRARNASAFIQDDYKITPRFTLNLGLRWEYDGMPSDKYGNLTNIWLSQVATVPVPGTSAANGTLVGWVVPSNYQGTVPTGVLKSGHTIASKSDVPWNNFGPRVGFAWQPLKSSRLAVRGGYGFFYDRVPGDSMIESVQLMPPYAGNASAQTAATLAKPFIDPGPGFPARWVNFATGASSQINQTILAEQFYTPLVYSYNLNLQYEFLPRWVAEVGYVGSHGIHQFTSGSNPNAPYLASAANPVNGVTTNTTSNYLLRVPYLGLSQNFGSEATNGDFKFNSLQATLRRQFSRGLTFQAAYTFSRAFSTGNLNLGDPHNYRDQYGLNSQYRPHRLTLSYSWNIPYGNLKGVSGKLLSGWNLSGVTTIQDGTPLTITDKNGATIYGLTTSRAQMCAGKTYADIPTAGDLDTRLGGVSGGPGFFSPTAFCTSQLPKIGDGTGFGNSGIGVILGPGQFNWDVSLAKTTRVGGIREDGTLQFRAEFFNIFNHAQFSNPAVAVDSAASFGQITSTSVNPRLIQFALKYAF